MKIFLSHAAVDDTIADLLCTLLSDGVEIGRSNIFCSSLPGQTIEGGFNFIERIKERLQEANIVFVLFSQNYLDSQFCLAELGACWINEKKVIPLVVPPLKFRHLKATLLVTQAYDISTENGVDSIVDSLGFSGYSAAIWGAARKRFLSAIDDAIKNQPPPQKVEYRKYQEIFDENSSLQEKNDELIEKNKKLCDIVDKLKKCKNKEDVLKIELDESNEETIFDKLVTSASIALDKLPVIVRKAVYYESKSAKLPHPQPFEDDIWSDIHDATDSQYLLWESSDDPISLNDSHPAVSDALNKLNDLKNFLYDVSDEFENYMTAKNKFPFNIENIDFGEKYLFR